MADPQKRPHLGEIPRLVGVVRAHVRMTTPEGMGEFLRCYESVAKKLARTSGDMAGGCDD